MIIGSLCTGAGMLDAAATAVLGGHTAWVAESDPDAARVLEHRLGVPNLGDISIVDWTSVEPVDVLVAGYPCQDLSNAGKRAGIEGARSGVWRHVADAVRHLRPRLVLLENVHGHLARGFGRVLGDLAAVGYDADWTCLRASDVGAAHRRDRVFIVAAPADPDGSRVRLEPVAVGARGGAAVVGGPLRRMADGLARRLGHRPRRQHGRSADLRQRRRPAAGCRRVPGPAGRYDVTEWIVINGHAPWCAYIRSLGDICVDEEPCDCAGWDDDDTFWDEDEEVWS